MHKHIPALLTAALLLAPALEAAELRGQLLAPGAGDLVPATLATAKRALPAGVETADLDFAWPIDTDAALASPAPHVAQSREFWSLHDGAKLASGIRFDIGSPGALIRISPAEGSKASASLRADDLQLVLDGRTLSPGNGILHSASADELEKLGADFGRGSLVLQLDPAVGSGSGSVHLQLPKASGRHLLHVLEPNSDQVLQLSSDQHVALAGGHLGLTAVWLDGTRPKATGVVRGLLTAPDGRSIEVDFNADPDGRLHADVALPKGTSGTDGLWEAHLFAAAEHDGLQLLRDAKTAFAVATPTAKLSGDYRADTANGLRIAIGVTAAAKGRYEVRGTLYGSRHGTLVPFAVAHAARLLDAGASEIALKLDPALIAKAGVTAPFELRDLALNDQSRMAPQETRQRAARIGLAHIAARDGGLRH